MSHDSEELARLIERQQAVEEAIMHIQHDVAKLNGALVDQQRQLNRLQRVLEDVDDRLGQLDPPEKRDPSSERPPHY